MIKILHVISDENIGGAGRLLLNLLAEADREKFDISVVLPPKSLLTARVKKLGFEAIEAGLSLSNLYRIVKDKRSDIVHTHSAAAARIAARLCGVAVTVNTKHCAEEVLQFPPLRKRIAIRAFDALFTTHTVATAEYARERLIADGIPAKKTSVIINGSQALKEFTSTEKEEIRRRLGYRKEDFIVGMVARMEYGKGQEYFIKAAEICQKNYPNIKFILAGSGSAEQSLEAMASELNNVKFLGFISDVTELMNILDANANCSYISETSSLSLSEGMSVGAIPIVSDCGGNSFMAKDCGIVFPKKDSRALADALIYLSKSPKEKELFSHNARQRFFTEFTAEKMAKKTENLYFNLLK